MKQLLQNLVHPYSRYGLAVALFEAQMSLEDLTKENVSEVLAKAIEAGLENFRLMTDDDPQTAKILRFRAIKAEELKRNKKLVFSSGLPNQGIYLAPTIITNLPLDELIDFLDIFQRMLIDSLKENVLEAMIKPGAAERKYIRPRIFWGNYPFAPREAAFGAVGLLAAIGKWGQRTNQVE